MAHINEDAREERRTILRLCLFSDGIDKTSNETSEDAGNGAESDRIAKEDQARCRDRQLI